VPEHWEILPALAVYRPRQVKNIGMIETTVLSLSYGQIIVKAPDKLHGLVPESFETYQVVDPGNIIVRTTDLQNDQTSLRVAHSRHRGIITSAYMCLETTQRVSNQYGYQYLNAYDLLKIIYGFGSGLRQNLDFSDIKRMPVLVPPRDEQAAIIRFLDHSDRKIRRYIRAKQKLIKLLEEQKQAIIHRAVTRGLDPDVRLKPSGVEWLGDVPEHWEVRSFSRTAVERADYRGATPEKTDCGIFLVTAKNVRKGWIDYEVSKEYVAEKDYPKIMRRGLPKSRDLLLTMEAPLGHLALVDREDIALAQRIVRFRFDYRQIEPRYVLLSTLSAYFQNQLHCRGTGSTAMGIKASKLPQLLLVLLPLVEQRELLSWINVECRSLDRAKDKANAEITLLQEYRARLIADVVTGKLDVQEAAAGLPEEAIEHDVDEVEDVVEPETGEEEFELDDEADG